ncbi:hypothetical protein B0H13DRAFT_243839 [Mycena leptocephala]|nr:hypothetical protein B0H13DRAFT_243839 [Mycena leptocephala]
MDKRDQPRDCHRRYSRPTITTHAGGSQYREDALGGAADDGPQAEPLSIPHHRNVVIIGGGSDGKDCWYLDIISVSVPRAHLPFLTVIKMQTRCGGRSRSHRRRSHMDLLLILLSLPIEPRHPGKGPSACGYRVAPCQLLLLEGFRGPRRSTSQFSPIFCNFLSLSHFTEGCHRQVVCMTQLDMNTCPFLNVNVMRQSTVKGKWGTRDEE